MLSKLHYSMYYVSSREQVMVDTASGVNALQVLYSGTFLHGFHSEGR